MAICQIPDCTDHYGCQLRAKGVNVSPAAMPSRRRWGNPRRAEPSWEKGIATEKRPGGFEMPILTESGARMHVKEAAERRHEINNRREQLRSDPHVFTSQE